MIRRFHEAKEAGQAEVVVWGSGQPQREFLHADDAADGILHLFELNEPPDWVNLGTGQDVTIAELATLIAKTVGYTGQITFDTSKPDGTPRKLTDVSLIKSTGWQPKINLADGIAMTYRSFCEEQATGRLRES